MKKVLPAVNLNLWQLAWPISIEMLLIYAVGFMDIFFLSMVSIEAAAALGAIQAIMTVIILLFKQVAQGGGSVAAQFLGAKKHTQAINTFTTILIINLVLGLIVATFMFGIHEYIGRWLGVSEIINQHITIYLSIVSPALVFIAIRFSYSAIASSLGKTKWNMSSSIIANVVNVSLNTLFVTGWLGFPKLGVQGVAIATSISYFVYLVILLIRVHTKLNFSPSFALASISEYRLLLRPILRIAIPTTMEPVLFNCFQIALTVFVIQAGDLALASRTLVLQVSAFILLWSFSIAQANQIITAHHVGEQQFSLADQKLKKNTLIGIFGSIVITLIVIAFSEPILSIFTDDFATIKLCTLLFFFGLLMEPARAVNMIVVFSLGASGDAMFSTKLSLVASWFFALPLAYFLGITLGYGIIGIWTAMVVEETVRAVINYNRWTKKNWQRCQIISGM